MKKLYFSLLIIIGSLTVSKAQSNLDFEAWTSGEPDAWITLNFFNYGFGAAPLTTFQEMSNPGEGASSVKMVTDTCPLCPAIAGAFGLVLDDTIPGVVQQAVAYTGKPSSFDFMYKGAPASASDQYGIGIQLTHWDSNQGMTIVDGEGYFFSGANVNTWTPQNVVISYFTTDTPDTLSIVAASSVSLYGVPGVYSMRGSTMWLDAVVINSTIGISTPLASLMRPTYTYPTPATDVVNFGVRVKGAETILIYDLAGKEVSSIPVSGGITTMDATVIGSGTYLYRVTGKNNQVIGSGKFSVVR